MSANPAAPPAVTTLALEALLTHWREDGKTVDKMKARDELFQLSQERIASIVRLRLNRFPSLRDDAGVVTDHVRNLVTERYWQWADGDKFKLPQSIRAYFAAICTITRRVLLDLRDASDRSGGSVPDPAGGVERATSDAPPDDRIDLLLRAMDELADADEREAIRLQYYCGLEFQEIADVMGIRYQAAYRLVNRALLEIGTALRRRAHPDNFDGD